MPGYISEVDYDGGAGSDFVEIVVPAGVDTSAYTLVAYDKDGTIIETFSLGSPTQTIAGNNVYLLDSNDANWIDLHNDEALALVDDSGTVLQFISFKAPVTAVEGPASGTTSTAIGEHSGSNQSLETSDGGSSYSTTTTSSPGTIPCYAPGTMIDTPDGPRAVETLRPGDFVLTADHGPQKIRWVRSGDHPLEEADVDGKPVLIQSGALGPNRPAQDLIVSPQHRIIVGAGGQLMEYFDTMAFTPAKALTSLPGIRHIKGKTKITYVHFACDRHEVVTANGCQSESLLLGPEVLKGLTPAERRTVTRIFQTSCRAGDALNGPAARVCLAVGKVGRQLAVRAPLKQAAVAKEIRKWDRGAAMERYEAERLRFSQSICADVLTSHKHSALGNSP
ncbi:Hint domain-containing protein [Jannaschia ovalis]|uniref:Hint domain-containing protein n=1 Tax=Jannaschia ovalis TaxID=3038773 RepID=A0ABY8LBV8_9RHOB|nr:Hint domain-containing protein [Jannaschia sp. GRR-S6-38]WGH78616.1 Hint domain-containing protein [Jannaschia sp. GRR-S6-38]